MKAQRSWSYFFLPFLSFLHPNALDLDGNQRRIEKTTKKKDDNNGHKENINLAVGYGEEESHSSSLSFRRTCKTCCSSSLRGSCNHCARRCSCVQNHNFPTVCQGFSLHPQALWRREPFRERMKNGRETKSFAWKMIPFNRLDRKQC